MSTTEINIFKSILFHKNKEILEIIKPECFSIPVIKTMLYCLKKYNQLYHKFPNKAEFLTFFESLLQSNQIDLPLDELQRNTELQRIQNLANYLNTKEISQEELNEILNLQQLKEEIQKLLTKNVFKNKLDYLKQVLQTGQHAEQLLSELKTDLTQSTILIEETKTIDWFLNLEIPVRNQVLSTGYLFLDKHIEGGLGSGEIALIASPPGKGKTTFLTNLMYNYLQLHSQAICFYVTLELNEAQIFARLLSLYFQTPLIAFKGKSPQEIIMQQLKEKLIPLESFKDFFKNCHVKYFPPGTNVTHLISYIEQFKKTLPQDAPLVIFLDYLNEIDFPYIKEIWHKFDKITTELDRFATENNAILWIACQAHPKTKKLSQKELQQEDNIPQSKILFDLKDLYGSKIGLSKKLTIGLGITQLQTTNQLYLSFFKNRITGQINEVALLKFDKSTYRLEIYDNSTYTEDFEIPQEFDSNSETSNFKKSTYRAKMDFDFKL
jgi:RecA/RadA recombinase